MSDLAILQAAFAALDRLQLYYDDAIPWAAIEQGFAHGGEGVHFASRAIGIFKPAQMERGVLSIKTVVPRSGRINIYDDHQASGDYYRYSLQAGGAHKGANKFLWQAKELNQPFIYFYGVFPGFYTALWPCYVDAIYDRGISDSFCDVYVGANISENFLPPLEEGKYILPDTIERRYAIRDSKVRLHQSYFRQAVLSAYRNRCAMTGLPMARLLDAAHIIPDAAMDGEASVRNGIALSKLHHSAFDKHLIGIDPDFRIHISDEVMQSNDGPLLELGLKALHQREICLPGQRENWPDRGFLDRRYEAFCKEAG